MKVEVDYEQNKLENEHPNKRQNILAQNWGIEKGKDEMMGHLQDNWIAEEKKITLFMKKILRNQK